MAQRKEGKKTRKYGRWARKPKNLAYKAQGRRDANKKRRIAKLMKRFPDYRAPGWKLDRKTGEVSKD